MFRNTRLPFRPTRGQRDAMTEILDDVSSRRRGDEPMRRVLQGDVGSGKTMVALTTIHEILRGDQQAQAALLAHTEFLARQHYERAKSFAGLQTKGRIWGINKKTPIRPDDDSVFLLVGSSSKQDREDMEYGSRYGIIRLVIGTHALMTKNVRFRDLRIVVIDEE